MARRVPTVLLALAMVAVPATSLAGDGSSDLEAGPLRVANDEQHETRLSVQVDRPPEAVGAWGPRLEGEVPAVNLAVLPGGRLLYYDGFEVNQARDNATHVHFAHNATPLAAQTRVARIDDDIEVRTPVPESGGGLDLFCSGTTITPEGLAVTPGGNRYFTLDDDPPGNRRAPIAGANQTLLFPGQRLEAGAGPLAWATGPNMTTPRWYPSALQLPDGDTLVVSGTRTLSYPHSRNTVLERLDPDALDEGWRVLEPSLSLADGVEVPQRVLPDPGTGAAVVDQTHRGPPNVPSYPRLHAIPAGPHAGELLYASSGYILGPHPVEPLWGHFQTLDPDTGSWEVHARSALGTRNLGAAVPLMVDASEPRPRYLSLGGSVEETVAGTATAELVDASRETIRSRPTEPMHVPRWSANGVLLPDGSVLALGGGLQDDVIAYGSPTAGPLNAERFVPDGSGGEWELLPAMEDVRAYHSTAVLLPDARVAVGGHVPPPPVHDAFRSNGNPQANDTTFEVYEPAYLHHEADDTRPRVIEESFAETTSVPGATALRADPGERVSFRVEGVENGVRDVVLRRPGAATHQYNADQLGVRLDPVAADLGPGGGGTVTVEMPGDLAIPPGHYMLFVNEDSPDGVYPSEAAWVALGSETALGPRDG